jgi:signal transduction histidine kinase
VADRSAPVPGAPAAPPGARPRRRASLRRRITTAAVLAVALTLGVFTLVFALVQRAVLDDAPRSAATSDVDRAVAALEAGSTPAAAVAGEADGAVVLVVDDTGTLLAAGGEDDLVERAGSLVDASSGDRVRLDDEWFVVERDGADVAVTASPSPRASPSASPSPSASSSPSSAPAPSASASSGRGSDDADDLDPDDDPAGDDPTDDRDDADAADDATDDASDDATEAAAPVVDRASWSVVAARSVEESRAAASASLVTLGVAIPVALLVLGVTTWLVVGRALRPVETMRREVAEVTAANLSHRLPDPGGGDEVARLARTLNGMLDRLDSSATAQRRFVGDASHELKTPLATIRQHAEVALLHPEAVDGRALAGTVLGEEARLTALVQGLLVLARADEGALGVARRPVDLDDLVLAEASRQRAAAAAAAAAAEATPAATSAVAPRVVDATGVGPARVVGDEGLLGQVVRNLVANAARHAATTVALGLVDRDGRAVLTVDDDGAGVAEADRERVFDRVVRLDEARDRDAGGSGLGLAIVREIVRVHGGSVRVEASPRGGARVVVELPAAG